jgi:DNA repair photolyase
MNVLKENLKTIKINNREYNFCEHAFGLLDVNYNNPLICVSQSNNSLSIDYWKGCAWQCAYCHVQSNYENLDEDFKMLKKPVPRSKFRVEEIIDSLLVHPYFKKSETVISIATASTEPFGTPDVTENTLRIMEYFVELGLKNPFWIVTKGGIPSGISKRMTAITNNGNKIMISLSWCDNPKEIEPVQNDRFKNIRELRGTGVTISWYLRPLVVEWSANKKQLETMIKMISEKYVDMIDMIIPGGLRWTEGIEYGITELRNLVMPNLIKKSQKKTLSADIEKTIINLCKKYFPDTPVYFNSSCGISHMLESSNIALLNIFNKKACKKSICFNKCKDKCHKTKFSNDDLRLFEDVLKKENINIKIKNIDTKHGIINSAPAFESYPYIIRQQIKKTMAYVINDVEK